MSIPPTSPHVVHFSTVHQVGDVRVFLKECRSLADAGYHVTLIARGEKSDVLDGVHRIGLVQSSPGGRIGRMVLGTISVAKEAWSRNADLYHFHDPELIPIGLFFKARGKQVIYDAHESIRDQIVSKPYLPSWARRPLSRLVGLVEDFSIRRFDGVVTATPRIAETLKTAHTITAANYPVTEEIAPHPGAVLRDLGKVVFVGGFTRIRGAREMVEAIELVNRQRPCKLIICGLMPADVRAEVESLPGWKYVEDLGWQERDQTQIQMATAACGLCVFHPEPNHVEAVPNKLFEYMGAGLPVVVSNFPFWRQFIAEVGSGLMVDPRDSQAIAGAILEITNDSTTVAEMGLAGSGVVNTRFNWDAEAEKLVALYQRLLPR